MFQKVFITAFSVTFKVSLFLHNKDIMSCILLMTSGGGIYECYGELTSHLLA